MVQNADEKGREREQERERKGDRCERGSGVAERVRQRTDGTMKEGEGHEEVEEIHREGLVVRGDNMRFLTSCKSESREAPRPVVAPFPLAKFPRELHLVCRF